MSDNPDAMETKSCPRCGNVKAISGFRLMRRYGRVEVRSCCIDCEHAYHRTDNYRAISLRKNAKYRAEGKFREKEKRSNIHRKTGHPEKVKCNQMTVKAIKAGILIRPLQCEDCCVSPPPMKDGRSSIQAHHDDYSKPLDVRWLCHQCHVNLHRARSASPGGQADPEVTP